jgi:hypothetical protein
MNEKELQALLRKTQKKAAQKATKPRAVFDPTLEATRGNKGDAFDDNEAEQIFKEMKRREF